MQEEKPDLTAPLSPFVSYVPERDTLVVRLTDRPLSAPEPIIPGVVEVFRDADGEIGALAIAGVAGVMGIEKATFDPKIARRMGPQYRPPCRDWFRLPITGESGWTAPAIRFTDEPVTRAWCAQPMADRAANSLPL